jgi:hypothetical protein
MRKGLSGDSEIWVDHERIVKKDLLSFPDKNKILEAIKDKGFWEVIRNRSHMPACHSCGYGDRSGGVGPGRNKGVYGCL